MIYHVSLLCWRMLFVGVVVACFVIVWPAVCLAQAVDNQPPAQADALDAPPVEPAAERGEVKSPIVRKLLDALDEMRDDVDAGEREMLRQLLLDADDDLHRYTGDNARQMILRANQKRSASKVRAGICRTYYRYPPQPGRTGRQSDADRRQNSPEGGGNNDRSGLNGI